MRENIFDFSEMWIKASAICGMIGFVVFLFFTTTAMTLIPGYNILTQFFSELGVSGFAAMIFNSGLMMSGLLFAIFFLGLNFYLKKYLPTGEKEPLIARTGIVIGVASAISLIGVGLFPMTMPLVHLIPTAAFFGFAGVSIMMLSVYLFSLRKKIVYVIPGIAVIVIDSVFALYTIPVIQKVAVFAIAFWFLAMAVRMYTDTK